MQQGRRSKKTYMAGTVVGGPGWVASEGKAAVAHCVCNISVAHPNVFRTIRTACSMSFMVRPGGRVAGPPVKGMAAGMTSLQSVN